MIKRETTKKTQQLEIKNQFQIEYKDPQTLIPYANNSKTHPDSQVSKLAGVIDEFDFDVPIVIDEKGIILKGHGRLAAAQRLGLDSVPTITRTGLSEAQKKAIRINDNRVAESDWDNQLLAIEIQTLMDDDFDIKKLGFDEGEIEKLLAKMEEDESIDQLDNYLDDEEQDYSDYSETSVVSDSSLVTFSCYMAKSNREKLLDAINQVKERYNLESIEASLVKISEVIINAQS